MNVEEYHSYDDIVELINSNSKYKYVSFVYTPWHLHSAIAFLNSEECKVNPTDGLFVIMHNPRGGYLIPTEYLDKSGISFVFLRICSKNRKYEPFIFGKFLFNRNKIQEKDFYILSPGLYYYALASKLSIARLNEHRIICVAIDEGIGTYINNSNAYVELMSLGFGKKILTTLKIELEEKIIKKALKRKGQILDYFLFKKINDKIIENSRRFSNYAYAFSDFGFKLNVQTDEYNSSHYVIICTAQDDGIYGNFDIANKKIIGECIKLFKEKGYDVLIKKHPRDDSNVNYEGAVILRNSKYSMETILSRLERKPDYIIGYDSTVLVTAKLLFGINTISLLDMLLEITTYSEVQKKTVDGFKSVFGEYFMIPSDFGKMRDVVKNED